MKSGVILCHHCRLFGYVTLDRRNPPTGEETNAEASQLTVHCLVAWEKDMIRWAALNQIQIACSSPPRKALELQPERNLVGYAFMGKEKSGKLHRHCLWGAIWSNLPPLSITLLEIDCLDGFEARSDVADPSINLQSTPRIPLE